ncbi:hypothetical protein [uncultured Lutibacter sp.]|uniref:hypothetical protein n=1 Tax=uncultured Lutibacter sp. TaxID=437739 RepID=UPI00261B013B|nr:hypothetical protein [uncultured Lutibacter sp.]
MLQKYSRGLFLFSFLLFIFSAIYGLVLRWNFAFPSNIISYKNLVQGHSHVAFLGWGYLATIGAIFNYFIPKENLIRRVYSITLAISVISITLMLFSFLLSGYKAFSIALLSVFGITTYVLSFQLLKDIKGEDVSTKFIRFGIYYYLISSLATWFLAFVIVTQGKTELYYNTVYFYLHFLYNGFFVFCLFGILFKILKKQSIELSIKNQKYFFIFLNIACIPAYFLSVLWSTDQVIFNVIGLLSAILQLIAMWYLIKILISTFRLITWDLVAKYLLSYAMIAFSFKIIAQLLSSFPYFVKKSIALKPYFIIGYLHLFTLAFMSVTLLLILKQANVFNFKSLFAKIGLNLFLVGILLSEILLFSQGGTFLIGISAITYFHIFMLIFSFFIVLGLILIFVNQLKLLYNNVK